MRAHAIGSAVRWAVVSVAELFRINLVVLREQRCRRRQIGDFIDQRNNVISGRGNCKTQIANLVNRSHGHSISHSTSLLWCAISQKSASQFKDENDLGVFQIKLTSYPRIDCTCWAGRAPRDGTSRSGTARRSSRQASPATDPGRSRARPSAG